MIMNMGIIPPVVTFIRTERDDEQLRTQSGNIGDTGRMCERKRSGSVYSHVHIRYSSESFSQPRAGSLRINMPANMTVADVDNAYRIFGKPQMHLAQPLEKRG